MKKFFQKTTTILILIAFLLMPLFGFAQTNQSTADVTTANQEGLAKIAEYKKAKTTEEKIGLLREAGDKFIEFRKDSLETLKKKLESANIADEDKKKLVADVDDALAKLDELKNQIDTETDLTKLKEEVKSIFKESQIYLVVLPRIEAFLIISEMKFEVNKLDDLSSKIEQFISEKKAEGKDTKKAENSFADYKKKITDAKKKLDQAALKFNAIKLGADNKKLLTDGKTLAKSALTDIKTARADIKKILDNLK